METLTSLKDWINKEFDLCNEKRSFISQDKSIESSQLQIEFINRQLLLLEIKKQITIFEEEETEQLLERLMK